MKGELFRYLPFHLIDRKTWGAHEPAEEGIEIMTPVPFIFHTYTDTEPCFEKGQCIKRVKDIQARDLADGLCDIRYNFLIGGDGCVYEGRGWDHVPDLHEDYPELYERSLEIAHIGFEGKPSDETMHVLKLFLRYGVSKNHVKDGFKYVKLFKNITKLEEHFLMDTDKDSVEITCYKKKGVETEEEESDEYKVLSDQSDTRHDHAFQDDNPDDLLDFGEPESIDVEDGIKIDSSLLDPDEIAALKGGDPEILSRRDKQYIYD